MQWDAILEEDDQILVPLDGSARAERALPVAAHIARAVSGALVLVQVVTKPLTYSPYLSSSSYAAEVIDTELDNTESYLNTLANSEPLAGIETDIKAHMPVSKT